MLRPSHIAWVFCAVLFGVGIPDVVWAPQAFAQPASGSKGKGAEAQAQELYKEAQVLKKAGSFRQALAKVQEAYAILPTPILLWPLADLHYLANQPIDGLKALARYRREMAPAEMEPGQQLADVEKLEGMLRAQQAYLRIVVPSGTQVSLDGQALDAAQRAERVAVNPGSHRLVLTTERGSKEVTVEAQAGQESTAPGDSSASSGSSGRYAPHLLTWGAVGVTSALLLSSTIVGGLALSESQSLSSRCPDHLCLSMNAQELMAFNEQVSARNTHALAAKVLLGITAVFAVGTATLIVFDWQRQRSGRTLLGGQRPDASPAPAAPAAGMASELGAGSGLGGRL